MDGSADGGAGGGTDRRADGGPVTGAALTGAADRVADRRTLSLVEDPG